MKAWTAQKDRWRTELKVGDQIDFLDFDYMEDCDWYWSEVTKQWRQARIENIFNEDTLEIILPYKEWIWYKNRWSYSIAEFESKTRIDYAWREN